MHDYCAYGLAIHSEIPLPELVAASASDLTPAPGPSGNRHVFIQFGNVDRHLPVDGSAAVPVWATSSEAFADYPGTAAYLVRDGSKILIDRAAGADERLIRLYLLGPILGLLLHQRKFLVLHASAVALHGQAVAFVGEKGMGKSTMAAALVAAGHPLVADDLVAVDTTAPLPLAYPGFPQLKLFPESARLLDADTRQLPKVHPDLDKRARRTAEGFSSDPLPLARIFVLADGETEAIEPLPSQSGFMELIRHSYLLAFLSATGSAAEHFHQAVTLAGRAAILKLVRRRSLSALPEVARMVAEELKRAA